MAFFGLTQIGAQSPFVAESRAALDLTYFSDEELEAAFLRVVPADRGSANVEQIGDILNVLYHGEPPEHEVDGLRERLDRGDASGFTLRDFVAAAAELRDAEERAGPPAACQFRSTTQLQQQLRKHSRAAHGPKEFFRNPVTTSQAVGWGGEVIEEPRRPRQSCEETQYAAAMVRHGVYF